MENIIVKFTQPKIVVKFSSAIPSQIDVNRSDQRSFTYADIASGKIEFGRVLEDRVLQRVALDVTTPFNSGITAEIGISTDHDLVMGINDNDLQTANKYSVNCDLKFSSTEQIVIYFGGSAPMAGAITMTIYTL